MKANVNIEASQGYIFQSNIFAGAGDDYVSALMPWQSVFKGGSSTDYGPTGLDLKISDNLTLEEVPFGDTIVLKGSRADWDLEFKDDNGDGSVTLASILNEQDYIATSNNNRIYGFERLSFGDILFDLVFYEQLASNVIYGQPEYFLFGNETATELNSSIGADLWEAFRFSRTRIGGIKGAAESRITVSTGPTGDTPYLVDGIAYATLNTEAGKDILYLGSSSDALVDTGADDDILEVNNAVVGSTLKGGSGKDSFKIGSASNALIELGLDNENDNDTLEILGSVTNTVVSGGGGTDTLILRGTFPDCATNKTVTDSSGTYLQLGTNRFYGFESITIENPPTPTPTTAVSEIRRDVPETEWLSADYNSQSINGIFGPGTSPITIATGDGDNTVNIQDESGTPKNITNAILNTCGGADVLNAAGLLNSTVNLGSGTDRATFTSVTSSAINGEGDNDTILLGGPTTLSGASINGGPGTDTLILAGLRSAWNLAPEYDGSGNLTGIRSKAAGVSSSVFSGFEIFQFNDWRTGENPGAGVKLSGTADAITGIIKPTEWEWLGFDYLTIAGISGTSQSPIGVETGAADNDLTLVGSIASATVATGNVKDAVKASAVTQAAVLTGADNDSVTISGAVADSSIDSGAGSDSIKVGSASSATIIAGTDAEADDDNVIVVGDLANTVIRGGGGTDTLRIEGTFAANTINQSVTDSSGTFYQLGTNKFYGFENITIVNPPTVTPPTPPTTGGGSTSGGTGTTTGGTGTTSGGGSTGQSSSGSGTTTSFGPVTLGGGGPTVQSFVLGNTNAAPIIAPASGGSGGGGGGGGVTSDNIICIHSGVGLAHRELQLC